MTEKQKRIDGISQFINGEPVIKTASALKGNLKQICKQASTALYKSAAKIEELQGKLLKQASLTEEFKKEAQELREEVERFKKVEDVSKIADEMLIKGMIKESDVGSKVEELLNMNSDALAQFKTAVEGVQKLDTEKFGVDSLSYLLPDTNSNEPVKEDMLTSFEHMKI